MKNFKKLFAIVLSIALILCSVPMVANAAFTDTVLNSRSDFLWGVSMHTVDWSKNYAVTNIEGQIKAAYEMGVKLIRIDGSSTTPGYLERVVSLCDDYGLEVLLIGYIPNLSTDSACDDTAMVQSYYTDLLNSLDGKVDYIQIDNEIDAKMITASGGDTSCGDYASDCDATVISNVVSYITPAIAGVKDANTVPQIIFNISYDHIGVLQDFQAAGIDWDVTGHDWYSDMASDAWSNYSTVANLISGAINKPIMLCEIGQRPTESLVASEETDADAEGYDTLINIATQAYGINNVIGATFYELADEPEKQANEFQPEAHYGLVKYANGEMVKKPIYNRIKNLLTGGQELPSISSDKLAPAVNNTNTAIDTIEGVNIENTVAAGAKMFGNGIGILPRALNTEGAEYIEMDVYISQTLSNRICFWVTNKQQQDATVKGAYLINVADVAPGWNHLVFDASTTFTKTETGGTYTFDGYDFTRMYLDGGIPFASSEGMIRVANISATVAASPEYPEANNENEVVDMIEGINGNADFAANTKIYNESCLKLPRALDTTGGEFIEMDLYLSSATTGKLCFWVSNTGATSTSKAAYIINNNTVAGWNHIVIDVASVFVTVETGGTFVFDGYNFAFPYLDGSAKFAEAGTVTIANLAVTKTATAAPPEYPEANNVNTVIDMLEGLNFENTVAAGAGMFGNGNCIFPRALDTTGAEYIELDIYISQALSNRICLWVTTKEQQDATVKGAYLINVADVAPGWNHLVFAASDTFLKTEIDGIYNLNGYTFERFYLDGGVPFASGDGEIKVANIATTKGSPTASNYYNEVDMIEGAIFENTIAAGVKIYGNGWCTLPRTLDTANAEYLEMDIYISQALSNRICFWVTNDSRENATVKGAYLINVADVAPGWNHLVFDVSQIFTKTETGGTFNFSGYEFTKLYFDGGVPFANSDGKIIIANLATTRYAVTPKYTNTLVSEHLEVSGNDIFTNGGKMRWDADGYVGNYAWYQGKTEFASASNFNRGDTLEFDLYLGAKPDNNINLYIGSSKLAWNTNRVAATINTSEMNAGWNHVIVPMTDFVINNSNCDMSAIIGLFFDGTLLNDTTATIEVGFGNFAVTVIERERQDMVYEGKVTSVYSNISADIVASANLSNAVAPYELPIALDLADITHIEFNLYVGAKCDVKFHLSSTYEEYDPDYGMDSTCEAAYTITGLSFGWNQVSIPVSALTKASFFESDYVTYYYFSGVIADVLDSEFAVEDFALTSTAIDYDIAKGDYNADNEIDMLDLISAKKASLASEQTWFANVAELDGAVNGVIDATDVVAIRKLLWTMF